MNVIVQISTSVQKALVDVIRHVLTLLEVSHAPVDLAIVYRVIDKHAMVRVYKNRRQYDLYS